MWEVEDGELADGGVNETKEVLYVDVYVERHSG